MLLTLDKLMWPMLSFPHSAPEIVAVPGGGLGRVHLVAMNLLTR